MPKSTLDQSHIDSHEYIMLILKLSSNIETDCAIMVLIYFCSESRYLLLLTENYGALTILQQKISMHNAVVIFGSSFPSDQEYTQVLCIKVNYWFLVILC